MNLWREREKERESRMLCNILACICKRSNGLSVNRKLSFLLMDRRQIGLFL